MDGRRRKGREFISTQGNCWHSVCASAREISASFASVRHSSPFSTLFIGAKKTHSTLSLHSLLRFIHGAHPGHGHVSQSVFGREKERGLVTQFSFPLSLLSPLSNTMQHPPIHRCFSHPHIALLDQSTTSYPIKRSSLLSE